VPVLMLWTEVVAFSRTLKSGKQKEKKKKKRKIDYRLLKKSGSLLLNLIFLSISLVLGVILVVEIACIHE